jgi:hypothetical protein
MPQFVSEIALDSFVADNRDPLAMTAVRHFGNKRNPGLTYPRVEDRLEKIGYDDRPETLLRVLGTGIEFNNRPAEQTVGPTENRLEKCALVLEMMQNDTFRDSGNVAHLVQCRAPKAVSDDRLEGSARKLGAPNVAYGTCSHLQEVSDTASGSIASSSPDTVSDSTTDLKNV